MAVLLQINKVSKRYGDQVLLDEAEAIITDDAKVGFIGRNGAGKSTLIRILLGEEELDSGEVLRHPKLRLGYLRQHDPFLPGESALDFLRRDSGQPEWKCGEVAGQFELKGPSLEGPIDRLSGGWQTRVKLAALLLHEPNLLLLDEPTNFLDLRTQILLEHFLKSFDAGCLIVSHDRAFLHSTCEHTLSLSRGKLTAYPGKVDAYLQFVQERREQDQRANETILAKRRHLEDFIARNKARASTATRAQSKSKMLEKLELKEVMGDEPSVRIRAPRIDARKGVALRCNDLAIGYPGRAIADDIQLEIEHGTRCAVVGDNGQGKTTFLRTIVDSLEPQAGSFKWGHGCQIGVYAQHVYTTLPEQYTVIDYLYTQAVGKKDQEILDVAGSFLFKGVQTRKKVSVLSGGERARLCLAALMLSSNNVLILDEPGNHLDVDTVEALIDALKEYEGTVIFTSHDRHFTGRVATNIIEVRDGRVVNHQGGYDTYVAKVNREIEAGERERADSRKRLTPGGSRHAHGAGALARTAEDIQRDIQAIERQMAELERRKAEVNDAYLAALDSDDSHLLCDQLIAVSQELSDAEETWTELQAELEKAG